MRDAGADQKGTGQVTGNLPTYPANDSMDAKNHTLSETVDWNPNQQFYAQANLSLVFNVINRRSLRIIEKARGHPKIIRTRKSKRKTVNSTVLFLL